MLDIRKIKISVTRDFLKHKNNSSPKAKSSCSSKQIDEQEYYKPAVELIYKILKEREDNNEQDNNCC